MSTHTASQRAEAGLTLIELIIALALFSLITSVAYSGMLQIMRASKALDDRRDVGMIANSIINRMTRELQLATSEAKLLPPAGNTQNPYPPSVHMIGTQENLRGGAQSDTITFVADEAGQYVPDGQTHTGVVQITYRVAPIPPEENPEDEDVYYLIRDEVPVIHPPDKAYGLRMTFPITSRLVELRFKYYDAEDEQWSDTWDESEGKLPTIVQFVLRIMSPSGTIYTYTTDIAVKRV